MDLHNRDITDQNHRLAVKQKHIRMNTQGGLKEDKRIDFTASITQILNLGLPNALTILLTMIQMIIALAFIGKTVEGNLKMLNGLTAAQLYISLVINPLNTGFLGGYATLGSNAYGNGYKKLMGILFWRALFMTYMVIIPLVVINFCLSSQISSLFISDAETLSYASQYLKIAIFFVLFQGLIYAGVDFLTIIDRAYINYVFIGVIIVTQIGFSWLFIFYLEWGLTGAAVAEILANAIYCICILSFIFIYRPEPECAIAPSIKAFEGLGRYFNATIPIVLIACAQSWGAEIVNIIALHMDSMYYSAWTIINASSLFLICFGHGISNAISILISRHLGSGSVYNAWKTMVVGVFLVIFINLLLIVIFLFSRKVIIPVFIDNVDIYNIALEYTKYTSLILIPLSINMILVATFQGIGKQFIAMINTCISIFGVQTLLALLLVYRCNMNIEGLYLAVGVGLCLSIIIHSGVLMNLDFEVLRVESLGRIAKELHGWNIDDVEEKIFLRDELDDVEVSLDTSVHSRKWRIKTPPISSESDPENSENEL